MNLHCINHLLLMGIWCIAVHVAAQELITHDPYLPVAQIAESNGQPTWLKSKELIGVIDEDVQHLLHSNYKNIPTGGIHLDSSSVVHHAGMYYLEMYYQSAGHNYRYRTILTNHGGQLWLSRAHQAQLCVSDIDAELIWPYGTPQCSTTDQKKSKLILISSFN